MARNELDWDRYMIFSLYDSSRLVLVTSRIVFKQVPTRRLRHIMLFVDKKSARNNIYEKAALPTLYMKRFRR